MMIPKAVVFDLGKVLLDFDYGIAVARLQKKCRLTLSELQVLINQSPLLLQYESNQISTAQFFEAVCNASAFAGSLDEFRAMFADIFTPIEPMVELHQVLRRNGVPLYLFSNTNEIAIGHIRDRFPFYEQFDGYILSYEQDAMKPDPKIYAVVEQVAGRHGADLLYIDDRPENVAGGQARGWRTVLHQNPERTRAEVQRLGLAVE